MDRYDSLILEIIQSHREENNEKGRIRLRKLEKKFWQSIESDTNLSIGHGRIGERITNLYIDGLIENKNGYRLTRKGKTHLSVLQES